MIRSSGLFYFRSKEGADIMKHCPMLHATAELHTDVDDVAGVLQTTQGMRFSVKETGDGWLLSRTDHNFFRPAIFVQLLPDEEGTLIRTEFRTDRMLLLFMCIWSLIVVGAAVWKGWLMLVLLPVFWACVWIGFALGVKDGKQDLIDLFGAYEVLE